MLEPSYRQAINHAWKLVWHHRILWIFGLLSVFIGQFGLNNFTGEFISKLMSDSNWWPASWGVFHIQSWEQVFWFVWAAFIFLSLAALILIAAVSAQGALIDSAQQYYRTHTLPNLTKAWHKGVRHFWRLLALNIFEKVIMAVLLAIVLALVNMFSGTSTLAFFGAVITVGIGFFLALGVSTVITYALGYIVAEDELYLSRALARSWRLFSRHLLVSLELSIILLLLNLLVVVVISLGSFAVLIPSFFISIGAGVTGYTQLLVVSVGLYLCLFVAFVALVGAIFNAFTTSAWMYLFMKMHHEGMASRVLHHARQLLLRKS